MKHPVCLLMVACFVTVFLAACGSAAIPEQDTASQSSSVEQDSGNEESASEATEEVETPAEVTLEASFPVENAKRAAVVAITNALATDVFAADNNTVDPTKYHSYADLSGYYMIVTSWGTWYAKDDATWHVDGLEMHPNEYNTIACVSLDVTYDGTVIDAEKFCNSKSAIFIVLPEEDLTKYFMVSLMIQQLYREILSVADEHGGKLPNRVVFYCDELGTIPPIESLQLIFSASRSRRLLMVPIIQSFGQLQKNYGKEGSEIIVDNCQCTIFGGFAPNSQTAEVLSKALGSRTVMSGSISRGKNDPSQSLQMMERPLMMPDELKSLPKGQFIVMKTGTHPMQTRLRLFLDWGITFDNVYEVPEKAERKVAYADKDELERRIVTRYHSDKAVENVPVSDKRTQASMSQQQSNYSLRDSKARQRQRSQAQEDKV
jgi:hypothetical protein